MPNSRKFENFPPAVKKLGFFFFQEMEPKKSAGRNRSRADERVATKCESAGTKTENR